MYQLKQQPPIPPLPPPPPLFLQLQPLLPHICVQYVMHRYISQRLAMLTIMVQSTQMQTLLTTMVQSTHMQTPLTITVQSTQMQTLHTWRCMGMRIQHTHPTHHTLQAHHTYHMGRLYVGVVSWVCLQSMLVGMMGNWGTFSRSYGSSCLKRMLSGAVIQCIAVMQYMMMGSMMVLVGMRVMVFRWCCGTLMCCDGKWKHIYCKISAFFCFHCNTVLHCICCIVTRSLQIIRQLSS